jgi:hypothetical protein
MRAMAHPSPSPLIEARRPRRRSGVDLGLWVLVVATASTMTYGTCAADKGKVVEAAYRCRSAAGGMFVGQSIPADCMDQDVEVLDSRGRVVRTIPGRHALEEQSQEKAAQDATAASAQRDRTLLATYLSVADIERLRDQRIELLEQQDVVTRQYIANLRTREERLVASVQRFRPYSAKPNAPPLPEQIASEIVNTVKGLQVYEQELAKNTEERDRVAHGFADDIARFKELKGIK